MIIAYLKTIWILIGIIVGLIFLASLIFMILGIIIVIIRGAGKDE